MVFGQVGGREGAEGLHIFFAIVARAVVLVSCIWV